MRLLLQRVKRAEVIVDNLVVGSIQEGLLVFLGIHKEDTTKSIDYLISKLVHLRIFQDEDKKMNLSVLDIQGSILVVSQFTLYGNCEKGRRPEFLLSADASTAEPLYEQFLCKLKQFPLQVASGKFGATMQVSLVNDGPVTLLIEK